eukprot:TRINITY_DN12435_c0_g1_i1.p1 TRINITY_DN12435_c0_g1~~TRINITY_DN12435_c0_g1_i1.p1  ORF type:complete len:4456 (+),score=1406.83 TRINITY_DN12435_c0_g1_i1:23-13369(+)
MVELLIQVTPIVITLSPAAAFTEQELRGGVTITLTVDSGCWVADARQRVYNALASSRSAAAEPMGYEAKKADTNFIDPTGMLAGVCPRDLEIEFKSTDFGVVASIADSYDIAQAEVLTFSFDKDMVGSSVDPIGSPNPLTVTITPVAGLVTLAPAVVHEEDIRKDRPCAAPIQMTLSLQGETWVEPYSTLMRTCIKDSFDSINLNSEFDRLNAPGSLTPLIDPASIVFVDKWNARVYIDCTPEYNTPDPELVLMRLGSSCTKGGLQPVAATGPSPPRFQIDIEGAAVIELLTTELHEADIRATTQCVDLALTTVTTADSFIDDSTRIYFEMVSDRSGSGWEYGFTARKAVLLQPSSITITGANSMQLRICFAADAMYSIDAEEIVTIFVHGTAVRSGITPNYKNNIPLELKLKPSPGDITLSPSTLTEDEVRNGAQLTITLGYGEQWVFNPASCFTASGAGSCSPPTPSRAMCDCAATSLCTPDGKNTAAAQSYGLTARFDTMVPTTAVRVVGTQALIVEFAQDDLFDATEDQHIRIAVPGCGTASGLATGTQYLTVQRTPGKIHVISQLPAVGSNDPCGTLCAHDAPLVFTERDVRAGNMEFVLQMQGDLWAGTATDVQSAGASTCPAVPPTPGSTFCPDAYSSRFATVLPTAAIAVTDADSRLLHLNFSADALYNLDVDERICFTFPAATAASGLVPQMEPGYVTQYSTTAFCFDVTVVAGGVALETTPAGRVCESDLRLGRAAFTIKLDEEFWDASAASVVFNTITGNLTCDPGSTDCQVFAGQKGEGLIPTTSAGMVDTALVTLAPAGTPTQYTDLYFPFPAVPLVTSEPRPWYNIHDTAERITVEVTKDATRSGLRPGDPNPLSFDVHPAKLHVPQFELAETDIRDGTAPIVFNITLDCEEWKAGGEALVPAALYAEDQPAPFAASGWSGRGGSIVAASILPDASGLNAVMQVALQPDAGYDICTKEEVVAIDFSIEDLRHFTRSQVEAIFDSGESPTPYYANGTEAGVVQQYRSEQNSTLLLAMPHLSFKVTSQPFIATMTLFKPGAPHVACSHPCVFTEAEIRSGGGGVNITLTGHGATWSDPPQLTLGLNSTLFGTSGSFMDRMCLIAPRSGVAPQLVPPAEATATINFFADADFDIIVDELVTMTVPTGEAEVYDQCQNKTWPAAATCYILQSGTFSFRIDGEPGRALSCDCADCDVPSAPASAPPRPLRAGQELMINITGTELDSGPEGDVAYAVPVSVPCSDGLDYAYANLSDMLHTDLRGQTSVTWNPTFPASGLYRTCYISKGTLIGYDVSLCSPINVVGDPHNASTAGGAGPLGPFRLGSTYDITFMGRGLTSHTDRVKAVAQSDPLGCESPHAMIEITVDGVLEPRGSSNVGPYPPNGYVDPELGSLNVTEWRGVEFTEAGWFRMCYLPVRAPVWTDLGMFGVYGVVSAFDPEYIDAAVESTLQITGLGLQQNDTAFFALDTGATPTFDPAFSCAAAYPGDALGGAMVNATSGSADGTTSTLSIPWGTVYRPGLYHLCYRYDNTTQWDVVPNRLLKVIPSISDHSPTVGYVNPAPPHPDAATPTEFDLTGWSSTAVEQDATRRTILKLVRVGEGCSGGQMGYGTLNRVDGGVLAGPNVSDTPDYSGYQLTFRVHATFTGIEAGTYNWCYSSRAMLDCPTAATTWDNCAADTDISFTKWFMIPGAVVISPRFDVFAPEFIPSYTSTTVTAPAMSPIDLSRLGTNVAAKLVWGLEASCAEDDPRDEATFTSAKEVGVQAVITFDLSIERAGYYMLCLGTHRLGIDQVVGVYPRATGHAPVSMEERAAAVNPTNGLPATAKPLPIRVSGYGLHGPGVDQTGLARVGSEFGAVPWGVEDSMHPGQTLTCANYTAFTGAVWWQAENPDVLREGPTAVTTVTEGNVNRSRTVVYNDTLTPGRYVLCHYDWVRDRWLDIPDGDVFYIPPNTAPVVALRTASVTYHADSGTVAVADFLSTFSPGTYAAENGQTVAVALTPVDSFVDTAPFAVGGLPQYYRDTNTLRFRLIPSAPPGSYRFTLTAQDNGGVMYSGQDTVRMDFAVHVRGITGVVLTPRVLDVRETLNATFVGAGLTGGVAGDCVRIISADDPMNCNRLPDLPDRYKPICPVSVPDCYTEEDRRRIDDLAAAWTYGNTYGPWSVPEVVPQEIMLDPTFPDPLNIYQNQLIDAWREGKRAASVHDICRLTPESSFATLLATTLITPPMEKPGNYSLCYKLAQDAGAEEETPWTPVADSVFIVDPSVTQFAPHALLAAVPGELKLSGYGLASIDEVVGIWAGPPDVDWAVNASQLAACADIGRYGVGLSAGSTVFRGFVYSDQKPGGVSTGLALATLRIGEEMVRRPGMYQLCYRASSTSRWVDVKGGLLRVFASVHTHDATAQIYPGQMIHVNFSAVAVTPPDVNNVAANTTVVMKIVRADCGGLFPRCRVDCNNPDYTYFEKKTMSNIYSVTHPSQDGLSRGMTELVTFDRPGYYYPCWTTPEIEKCLPVGVTPETCISEDDHPWVLLNKAIIVTPVYEGFTPFVGEAGVLLTVHINDVDNQEVDFYDLGRPGLVYRNHDDPAAAEANCRRMADSEDHISDTVFRSIHYRDLQGFSSFKVNMTRAGDYDVCVGMTRIGDYRSWDATPNPGSGFGEGSPQGALPTPAPRRDVVCPYWTEVGARLSPVICDNSSTFLRNHHVRIQPRVTAWDGLPMEDRYYGAGMPFSLHGWGLQEGDGVYVINGTDGSSCSGWDGVPNWAKFGEREMTYPALSMAQSGWWVADQEHPEEAGKVNVLADRTLQPWGWVQAQWDFAFPRPGVYRFCYHSALFEWSRTIEPEFEIPLPRITDWDWVVAKENPPTVEIRVYGSGLNAMPNIGDRLFIVRNDQVDIDGPICQRDVFHFAVAERSENLGPSDAMGLNMTNFLWYDRDLNNYDFVRDYTICYAHCWLADTATHCEPYAPIGEIQTPIRNFPPDVPLAQNVYYSRPCDAVSIFSTPPTPGRAQEEWDSRSKAHLQNVTYSVTYTKIQDNATDVSVPCSSCAFADPYITAEGYLKQSFSTLGSYMVRVTARDDGGTAMGGIDTSTTPEFKLVLTGQNTAPFFTTVPRVSVTAAPAGGDGGVGRCRSVQLGPDTYVRACETAPVVIGEISAGSLDWEKGQMLYWDVAPVSGVLEPHFAAKPTFDPATRNLTVTLAPVADPAPAVVDVYITAYDDLVLGPTAPYPPDYCGESRTRRRVSIAIDPVNHPPIFNWDFGNRLIVYEQRQYVIAGGKPTVGPAHEQGVQELLVPVVQVVGDLGTKFSQPPVFLPDGTLSFMVAAGMTQTPPQSIRVRITLQDTGGTEEGGVDTAVLELELVVSSYYGLTVTPPSLLQASGAVEMAVTGGVPNAGMKLFYLWANSGGSVDLDAFVQRRVARDGVSLLAGPQAADSARHTVLPTGSHTVFVLVFADDVDWHVIERSGVRLCPQPTDPGQLDVSSTTACYLAQTLTVSPSAETVASVVAAARASAAVAAPAAALVQMAAAGEQLGDSSDAALREGLAGDVAVAAKRLAADPATQTSDQVGNGVAAVQAAIPTGGTQLSNAAVQSLADALGSLAEANAAAWERCCGAAVLPAGCTDHKACAASCCGGGQSQAEHDALVGAILGTMDKTARTSTASAAPAPWQTEADRDAGRAPESVARRRQAANAMASVLNGLNAVGASVCRALHSQGLLAMRQNQAAGYTDQAPYVKQEAEFATHITAMHKDAVVKAADAAVLPTPRGDVTAEVGRDVATRNSAFHGCRTIHTFYTSTPFQGDGDPALTPALPVVSVLLAPIDAGVSVGALGEAPYKLTVPTGRGDLENEDLRTARWEHAAVNWVEGNGSAAVEGSTAVITGSSSELFGAVKTPQGRRGQVLEREVAPGSVMMGAVVNPAFGTMCFACTAVPVYWGVFVFFAVFVALCLAAVDKKPYQTGQVQEGIDKSSNCCTQIFIHHMWTAPLLRLPVSLGYYSRFQRFVTLFSFFIVALAMPGPFYDNEGVRYAWEADVDWGKAVWVGSLSGVVGALCSWVVLMVFFAGARPGVRTLLKPQEAQAMATPVKPSGTPASPDSPATIDASNVYVGEEREVLLPAMAAGGRLVLGLYLFVLLGIGGSVAVFFLTDEYTVAAQGEQYMAAFLFACIFHILFETLRAFVAMATGFGHGQGSGQPLPNHMEEMSVAHTPPRGAYEDPVQPTFDASPPPPHRPPSYHTPGMGPQPTPSPQQPLTTGAPMPVPTGMLGGAGRGGPRARQADFGVVRSQLSKSGYDPTAGSAVGGAPAGVGGGVFRSHTQALLNAGGGAPAATYRSHSEGLVGHHSVLESPHSHQASPQPPTGRGFTTYNPDAYVAGGRGRGSAAGPRFLDRSASQPPGAGSPTYSTGQTRPFSDVPSPPSVGGLRQPPAGPGPLGFGGRGRGDPRQHTFTQFAALN